MPEYLAPGVFIEETSFRAKSIEGVSTTTTGFVGPTCWGPTEGEPLLVTSLAEFERWFGHGGQHAFGPDGSVAVINDMWHATRAFFTEGGRRLYVSRIYKKIDGQTGRAQALVPEDAAGQTPRLVLRARFPGACGNFALSLIFKTGQNVFSAPDSIGAVREGDLVVLSAGPAPEGEAQEWVLAMVLRDPAPDADSWLLAWDGGEIAVGALPGGTEVRPVRLAVRVRWPDGREQAWTGLGLDPERSDALTMQFAEPPARPADALERPLAAVIEGAAAQPRLTLLAALDVAFANAEGTLGQRIATAPARSEGLRVTIRLDEGSDGLRPSVGDYEGAGGGDITAPSGLKALEDMEDISIVAAPGHSRLIDGDGAAQQRLHGVAAALLAHAERMRYRIAVLDGAQGMTLNEIRRFRSRFDSKHGALYYPWVKVNDPISDREVAVPPSGFIAGVYARNDVQRAVYKAPANEVLRLAVGFEATVNHSQQEVLNPEGINCLRFFEGRGFRVWGARTVSSDSEWKYVSLRRYFNYVERSIDRGTQWAVFEPNGEALWANVRRTVEDFLYAEWRSGALLGDKPEAAYFVRCDRTTMTQNDLDNGRLVCLVGLAVVRPAEFVIFRIGQWTGDARQ